MLGREHRRNWWHTMILLIAAAVGVLLVARAYYYTATRTSAEATPLVLAHSQMNHVDGRELKTLRSA